MEKVVSLPNYSGRGIIFIVGCARSGTTWLQQLLASHPKARTGHESYLFSSYIGPQLRAWNKERKLGKYVGLGSYLRQDEFMRVVRLYTSLIMNIMIGDLAPDDLFIEKTPNHCQFMPEIVQILPNCRIIHIIRDPRDVVASMIAASKTRIGADWAPDKASDAARKWLSAIKAVREAEKNLPKDQLYTIRYEKLLSTTEEELQKLCIFLRLEWSHNQMLEAIERNNPKVANERATRIPIRGEVRATTGSTYANRKGFVRKAKPGSWKEDLSFTQKIAVWRVVRKAMAEEGYLWKYPW